ncbi:MAG: TIR domain-containing protein [Rubrivivax sp.]|nr:MAG: TIR domain-containing protein [Rubrivivax sp.]
MSAERRLAEAFRLLDAAPTTADALTRADALWLARVLPDLASSDDDAADGETGKEVDTGDKESDRDGRTADPAHGDGGSSTRPVPDPAPPAPTILLFAPQVGSENELQLHARKVPVPAADALPGRAAFERALRPFLRRRPSPIHRMVDAEATAEASAQASADALMIAGPGRAAPALTPVLRPVPERWFDMVLLAEQDDTMRVFEDTLRELQHLLARHGAFRRVGLWRWSVSGDALHVRTASGMPCAPHAMLQGQHPQLVWVLTHGAAAGWDVEPLRGFVRGLAARAVVAVVQLLPETSWGATALGEARERVRSRERAATNRQLLRRDPWMATWAREGASGVVPMLSLQSDAVARWAEFVMSPRAVAHASVDLSRSPDNAHRPAEPVPADATAALREQVQRFRAIASPQAFALLRLLSGAWITLPVMRLLLQSMPGPRALTPMAEVLLSDLLRRTSPADVRTEELSFDFVQGLREWLSGSLSTQEQRTLDEAMADSKEAIRQFVETASGRKLATFNALLLDPAGSEWLPASAKSFVEVSRRLRALRDRQEAPAPAAEEATPVAARAPSAAASVTGMATRSDVRTLRILHLSDLHIGMEPDVADWRKRPTLGKAWQENLQRITLAGAIDLVCFTGDITETGAEEEFDQAEQFVREMLETLDVPLDRFFCVPGNHDIHHEQGGFTTKTPASRAGFPLDPFRKQWGFRKWLRRLNKIQPDEQLGYLERLDLGGGAIVSLIGLDTAWPSNPQNDAVELGGEQLVGLNDERLTSGTGIALMHHPRAALLDWNAVEERLASLGVGLLMHGHAPGRKRPYWVRTKRGLMVSSAGYLHNLFGVPTRVHVIELAVRSGGPRGGARAQPMRLTSREWRPDGRWHDVGVVPLAVDGSTVRRPSIFISYAQEDVEVVRTLVQELETLGFDCHWCDVTVAEFSDEENRRIEQALAHCDYFMPVLSAAADARKKGGYWTEWRSAVDRSHGDRRYQLRFLVPIGIDDFPPSMRRYGRIFKGSTDAFAKADPLHAPKGRLGGDARASLLALLSSPSLHEPLHERHAPDIEQTSARPPTEPARRLPRILVSYALQDQSAAQSLYQHLSSLHAEERAEVHVHSDLISVDQDRSQALEAAMAHGDIFILLLSRRYLASEFCMGLEARLAMERLRRFPDRIRVCPVLLDHCDYEKLRPDSHPDGVALGELPVLGPHEGSGLPTTLSEIGNTDLAWIGIAQRLSEVVDELQDQDLDRGEQIGAA